MSVSYGPKLGLLINALTGDAHDVAFRALLRALDQVLFLSVKSRTITAPPGSPANGDAYIVATGGTGAWSGHDKSIAVWSTDNPAAPSGEWEFYVPAAGWLAFSVADAAFYSYSGTAWAAFGGGGSSTLASDTDVTITSPLNNDVLTYETSSTKWKNKPAAGGSSTLAADTDVVITSPANNDVLTYETSSTKWKNKPASGGAPTAIAGINNQTGTSYVLALGDAGFLVRMNNAAANTCTIPPHSSVAFPLDTVISIRQLGAGITTIVAGAGVTITSPGSLAIARKNGTVHLIQVATDTWDLMGDVNMTPPPAFALVAQTGAVDGGGASAAIDTTGANLLVAVAQAYTITPAGPVGSGAGQAYMTDSKGNTWYPVFPLGPRNYEAIVFFCFNPTVGPGHTFTYTNIGGYGVSASVAAFKGLAQPPFLYGTVSTAGTAVTWLSGPKFTSKLIGNTVYIGAVGSGIGGGAAYVVAAVADDQHLTLTTSAGTNASMYIAGGGQGSFSMDQTYYIQAAGGINPANTGDLVIFGGSNGGAVVAGGTVDSWMTYFSGSPHASGSCNNFAAYGPYSVANTPPAWSSGRAYVAGYVVSYGGLNYICTNAIAAGGGNPSIATGNWAVTPLTCAPQFTHASPTSSDIIFTTLCSFPVV